MSELKFTQEVKDKWLEALKSGDYKQGFVHLHNALENTYCCIGVLATITEGLECSGYAPQAVCPYNFLNQSIGRGNTDRLWGINDSEKYNSKYPCDYSNVIPLIEALEVQE